MKNTIKNTFKLFGIIALVAVIGFSFVACGGDDDGGSSGGTGGGGGSGGISGGTVMYPTGIADADKPIDFSYLAEYSKISPLSNYVNEPASVTISGGKLTIKLGTPKEQYLDELDESGITVTPSDTKLLSFSDTYFSTADKKYFLACVNDSSIAALCYADKDVTIKGTHNAGKKDEIWNVSLKKGWNFLIRTDTADTETYETYTSPTSQPSGFIWTVYSSR